ncbi:cell division protein FtsQ/DivIB [Enteractinococcus coprophilus]|uniref:Cell division protein FtsQ n=1 Tax=Enteractinococcus coprophilus TaxID=1027633 RepID=A0A543AJS9_9MICC|nr:cell division protein FtsQ/DivIB [Enteractinococcus coprophilus]TQL72837.1 cell division protein FtsQ [Enteractinococcus coprophilus]
MSKSPSDKQPQEVTKKYPGLTEKKPVKSISVERPLHSDQKTVTETNLDPIDDDTVTPAKQKKSRKKPARPKAKQTNAVPRSTAKPSNPAPDDHIVLELPPSPEHRKAKRRKVLWIWTGIILTFLTAGWAILYFSPILAIEDVSHEGLDLVAQSEAEERTTGLVGIPLPQVTDRKVTELFADNPAVDHVTLRAEPPHGIVVIVHEHKPIAMSPSGKQYVVFSDEGTELAEIPSKRAQEFDLPVVASASDVTDQEVFDTITAVLGSLPEDLREQVRAASGTSIDSIELELSSGKMVMWGNSDQAEKKAQVLEALLGLDKDEAAEISEYDVSAPDFPVTR